MANALIAFGNRIDASLLSGGSWQANLPLVNLQNLILGKVARTIDTAKSSSIIQVDVGDDKNSRTIGLINHNFSLVAKYRIRCGNDPTFAVTMYDTGWTDVWPPVYVSTALTWQSLNYWSGRYLAEEILGYNWTLINSLPVTANARYWIIEIDDTGNAAGYLQLGRIFIGDAWQTVANMSYGAAIGWETNTDVQQALSGAEYFSRKTPYRVATFGTDSMSLDEAYGSAFEIQRRVGIDGEVLFQYDPADTVHKLRRQFLGRLRKLSPIENPFLNVGKTAWEIKERL